MMPDPAAVEHYDPVGRAGPVIAAVAAASRGDREEPGNHQNDTPAEQGTPVSHPVFPFSVA
jgi:hypothetical protein